MQPKINWIDNLRGITCLMVIYHNVIYHQCSQRQSVKLGYCKCPKFSSVISGYFFLVSAAHIRSIFRISPSALSFIVLSP